VTAEWDGWRKCPVCGVLTGEACQSLSGTVTNGRPDAVITRLDVPHTGRRPSTAKPAATRGGTS
jgi:hypothetical protein